MNAAMERWSSRKLQKLMSANYHRNSVTAITKSFHPYDFAGRLNRRACFSFDEKMDNHFQIAAQTQRMLTASIKPGRAHVIHHTTFGDSLAVGANASHFCRERLAYARLCTPIEAWLHWIARKFDE